MKKALYSILLILLVAAPAAVFPSAAEAAMPYIDYITARQGDGIYNAGDTIELQVYFNESVTASGVALYLNTNRSCVFCVFYQASASCFYTVQSGDATSRLTITSVSGSFRNRNGETMWNSMPMRNLDQYRNIRIGSGSSTYDPYYNPSCPYNNYNSYNTYDPYNASCAYGSQPTIEDLVRQINTLQTQLVALIVVRDTRVAVAAPVPPPQTGQVLGAMTIHLAFPVSVIGRDLFYGMTGEDVGVLQGVLTAEGYYVPPTGYFGPKTQSALASLQRKIGYPQTGVFDYAMRQWAMGRGY